MKARVSNANQRATGGDRKVVFKSVLDNPFKVRWPHVPHNIQNVTLASLVTILDGVGAYHLGKRSLSRKRKRVRHNKEKKEKVAARKRRKIGNEDEAPTGEDNEVDTETHTDGGGGVVMDLDPEPDIEAPSMLPHLTIGINEVTKRLEVQAQSRRLRASITASTSDPSETSSSTSKPEPERAPLVYVFVCRADIDPQLLVGHLPELVASCNTPIPGCTSPPVHLITLPKHAENTLAVAVGLRRVSVLAIDSTTPSLATISSVLADVQPPSASWLTGPAPKQRTAPHIPTHIKQLRTTAPRDMRAANQVRTEGRRAAKATRKANFQNNVRNKNTEGNKSGLSKVQRNTKAKVKAKAQPSKIRITAVSSTAATSQDLLPT